MDQTAVSLKDVSKKFRLYGSSSERFFEAFHPFNKKYHREFWALRDINFEVPKGQTLGIIGRNGSGKSTLLQIICSILRPTTGSVKVSGRVSSILELGAGFNPDFTGRSNVLLNGSLMGLSEREIKDRMPQIEAFADIGEFIDQPVKIYSSGMFVRLAFAAAVNVDPDILVIDEALAVGDAKFQFKCYQKFNEYRKAGKTIIFVTHDMDAIVKHSDQAILLEKGAILDYSRPKDVVNKYYELILTGEYKQAQQGCVDSTVLADGHAKQLFKEVNQTEVKEFIVDDSIQDKCSLRKSYNQNECRFGNKHSEIIDYLVVCKNSSDPLIVSSGESVDIFAKIKCNHSIQTPVYGLTVKTKEGIVIYATNTWFRKDRVKSTKKGELLRLKFSLKLSLASGDYFISQGIAERVNDEYVLVDSRNDLIHLTVKQDEEFDGIFVLETNFEELVK